MKYFLVLFLGLVGCAQAPSGSCTLFEQGTKVVHSFGDSITSGTGATTYCDAYQPVMATLMGLNSDNQGVSGSIFVSDNQYGKIMALNSSPGDIYTLLPGFNDVNNYGNDPTHLSQFQTELTTALNHLGSLGITIVGTTLYASVSEQATTIPLHTNQTVDQYVSIIKTIVSQVQSQGLPVYLADTNSVYNPETMSDPGNFHPNNNGHAVIAQEFFTAYQEAIK